MFVETYIIIDEDVYLLSIEQYSWDFIMYNMFVNCHRYVPRICII